LLLVNDFDTESGFFEAEEFNVFAFDQKAFSTNIQNRVQNIQSTTCSCSYMVLFMIFNFFIFFVGVTLCQCTEWCATRGRIVWGRWIS